MVLDLKSMEGVALVKSCDSPRTANYQVLRLLFKKQRELALIC